MQKVSSTHYIIIILNYPIYDWNCSSERIEEVNKYIFLLDLFKALVVNSVYVYGNSAYVYLFLREYQIIENEWILHRYILFPFYWKVLAKWLTQGYIFGVRNFGGLNYSKTSWQLEHMTGPTFRSMDTTSWRLRKRLMALARLLTLEYMSCKTSNLFCFKRWRLLTLLFLYTPSWKKVSRIIIYVENEFKNICLFKIPIFLFVFFNNSFLCIRIMNFNF